MNKSINCGAQDMLEAVIIQRRRINLIAENDHGELSKFAKIIPVDIGTQNGEEIMTFMTTDNIGGIIKLSVNTDDIISFEADDFKDPRIFFSREEDLGW